MLTYTNPVWAVGVVTFAASHASQWGTSAASHAFGRGVDAPRAPLVFTWIALYVVLLFTPGFHLDRGSAEIELPVYCR